MKRIILAAAALAAPFAIGGAAIAGTSGDPGDHAKKVWEKQAQCERKLAEAKSQRDFHKKAEECNREMAKLSREQRQDAAKSFRESEKKWREQARYSGGRYYDWDDD